MAAPKHKRNFFLRILCILAVTIGVTGCGELEKEKTSQQEEPGQQAQAEEEAKKNEADKIAAGGRLYILLYTNTKTERMFLQDVDTGKQEEYEYHGGTFIHNKFGDNMTAEQLITGELVELQVSENNVIAEVNIAESTFEYEGITDFSIDNQEKIISCRESNYYFDESLKVISDSGIISISELSDQDTITIRGEDKKVLTIVVTRGHGTVIMRNTEIFEGGMVTIGNLVAQKITADMQLEIPEGTYSFSVANEGYGGSREITLARSQELIVDLNDLKGEGPKSGSIKINVTPPEAVVSINGAKADCTGLLELSYGVYKIQVEAEGYDKFSGNMVINSPEGAITIDLDKTSNEEDTDTTKEDTDTSNKSTDVTNTTAGNLAGSLAGSKGGGGSTNKGTTGSSGTSSSGTSGSGTGTSGKGTSGTNTSDKDDDLEDQKMDLIRELLN